PLPRRGAWIVPGHPEPVREHELVGLLGGVLRPEEAGDEAGVGGAATVRVVAGEVGDLPTEGGEPPEPEGQEGVEHPDGRALHAPPVLVAGVATGVREALGLLAVLLHRGVGARRHLRDLLDRADVLGVVVVERDVKAGGHLSTSGASERVLVAPWGRLVPWCWA